MKCRRDERVKANISVDTIVATRFCLSVMLYFSSRYSPIFIPGNTENINIGTLITQIIRIS
jgi:hypothetical protein